MVPNPEHPDRLTDVSPEPSKHPELFHAEWFSNSVKVEGNDRDLRAEHPLKAPALMLFVLLSDTVERDPQ